MVSTIGAGAYFDICIGYRNYIVQFTLQVFAYFAYERWNSSEGNL